MRTTYQLLMLLSTYYKNEKRKIMIKYNLILNVDSYKNDHFRMLNKDISILQSSGIARAAKVNTEVKKIIPFGLTYLVREYLIQKITKENIDEAELAYKRKGYNFDRERWEYILNKYDGNLPIKLHSIKEGVAIPLNVPIYRIENTDENCAWLVSYLETLILRIVWYATTVATNANYIRDIFIKYAKIHFGENYNYNDLIKFMLHNFGARGASSYEAEIISSMAHALSFAGSDSMQVERNIDYYYSKLRNEQIDNNNLPFYTASVIASEHSVSCSLADTETENDYPILVRMLDIMEEEIELKKKNNTLYISGQNGEKIINPTIISIVIDTYDADRFASKFIGEIEKDRIKSLAKLGGKLVLRPDSGDATTMPIEICEILFKKFEEDCSINSLGFKKLPSYLGILQGDGINPKSINQILENATNKKIAMSNFVFGMGGQLVHPEGGRDSYSFAMKATAQKMKSTGEWVDLLKNPITDKGKKSLSGYISTFINEDGRIMALKIVDVEKRNDNYWKDMMVEIFNNGEVVEENMPSFNEIRRF